MERLVHRTRPRLPFTFCLPGFLFESNRGTKHSFTAETSLGPEFAAGFAGKKTKRMRSKMEAIKPKVKRFGPRPRTLRETL